MWAFEISTYLGRAAKFALLNSALSTNLVGLLFLITTKPSGLAGLPPVILVDPGSGIECSNLGLADNE